MQKLQGPAIEGPAQAGPYVRVRGARWRVVSVRAYDGCHLVTLIGASPANHGVRRSFLTPFDILTPIDRRVEPRLVHRARWMRACRALLASNVPTGGLRAALHARIDLL